MRRWVLPACARALRTKWTRQRCQVARSTLVDGGLQALMGVGDDQLHAAQAARRQGAQEVEPEGLRLRGADRHAEHLAPAVAVDADRDGDGDRDDAPGLADLHVGGVEPEIGPVALDRAGRGSRCTRSSISAQSRRDLALADPLHAHGADQVVHRAGRDALDVGLLDHRRQRLLGGPAGLQEGREVGAAPQLRDPQLDRAGPGLPVALAVAVALVGPVGAALAMGGAAQRPRSPAPSAAGRRSRSSRAGRSASEPFSSSSRRAILSSVIVVGPRSGLRLATQPYPGSPRRPG